MRMLALRLQRHQIHDIDDADLQFGQVLAQHRNSRKRFERWYVSRAGHYHVRPCTAIVAGPLPHPNALAAMLDGCIHVKILQRGLLSGDNHIDVIAAAQAVDHDRQQRVGVRRKIDSDDFSLLIYYVIDEAWVLMTEAIVILPPNV